MASKKIGFKFFKQRCPVRFLALSTLYAVTLPIFGLANPKKLETIQNFSFPALVEVKMPPLLPPGWPSKSKEPQRLMTLGMPQPIARPELVFKPALFVPLEMGLLEGNSRLVQAYNRALTSWSRGEVADVESIVQNNLELAKQLPRSHLERRNFFLLRGHFMFRKWLSMPDEPSSKKQAIKTQFMAGYFEAFASQDNGSLFSEEGSDLDGLMLRRSLQIGYVPHARLVIDSGKAKLGKPLPDVQIQEKPIGAAVQLKSQSLAVLWNAAVLQGEAQDWQKAFELAATADDFFKKLGPDGPQFSGVESNSVVKAYDVNLVENVISILPKSRSDFLGALHLLRANAFFKARDILGIIEHSEKAIKISTDPMLKAATFHLMGNVYFDIAEYALALKIFGWSEQSSLTYAENSPSLSFFKAEAAFWLGQYSKAKTLHLAFLNLAGDKSYGPFSKLRIANIDHLQSKIPEASALYEQINRLHTNHKVATDARVRLYCLSNLSSAARFQRQNLESVLLEIESSRDDLREQAMACAVKNQIVIASDPWKDEKARSLVALSAKQALLPIERFAIEYPESPFQSLFDKERRLLGWTEGKQILESEKCSEIVEFYKKTGSILFSDEAGIARWTAEEKKRLLRCSFLESADSLFVDGQEAGWEPATFRVQKLLFALKKNPSKQKLTQLRKELGPSHDLVALANLREKLGDKILGEPRFWILLAAYSLVTNDFVNGNPVRVSQKKQPQDCLQELEISESSKKTDLEKIFFGKDLSEWLVSLDSQVKSNESQARCLNALAQRLLTFARKGKSELLAKELWLPWLNKQDLKASAAPWLEYAQAQESNQTNIGNSKLTAKLIYEKIATQAHEGLEKEAAKLWLQQNP